MHNAYGNNSTADRDRKVNSCREPVYSTTSRAHEAVGAVGNDERNGTYLLPFYYVLSMEKGTKHVG